MKLYHRIILPLYSLILLLLLVYSYVLIDPNLTLVNNRFFESARNVLVQFGYYQREQSSVIYIGFIVVLFLFHRYFVKNFKKVNLVTLLIPLGILGLFSYPFLSHDFFNYLFDAKIVTFYQQNPYLHKALDFPQDPWLRFMHWTHRTYPYGPTFLPLTLIPSFLSFGKLLLNFLFFKTMFVGLFMGAVLLVNKINKKWAIFIATQPLIIFEGLVNSHNDLIGLSLTLIGIHFLGRKEIAGRLFLLASAGIKYISSPLIFLSKNRHSPINKVALLLLFTVMIYLSFWQEPQPWYFLALFALLPYFEEFIEDLNIFFAGLLFSYYPYVRFGGWDELWKVELKHQIMLIFFLLNAAYLLFRVLRGQRYNFLPDGVWSSTGRNVGRK